MSREQDVFFFFFQAEDGIRDRDVTGVQTCALPISLDLGELAPADAPAARDGGLPFPARLDDIVRAAARAMLETTAGNRSEAARRLGISRSRLQRLLEGASE